eukprot:gene32990-42103_t
MVRDVAIGTMHAMGNEYTLPYHGVAPGAHVGFAQIVPWGASGTVTVTHDDDYIQRGGVHWNEGDVRKESKIRMMVASPKFTGEGSLDFYKLGPVAGKGAFSTVYTAWHRLSGKRVAIKQYNLNRLARDTVLSTSVKREIKLLTKMNHPGIVHLYETFETRSVLCLVYEFIPNGTLFSALRKQRQGDVTAGPSTMTEAQVSRILLSLAQALQHMHSRNIMHRDMKLDNVMLLHDNKPKILDFGFGACCKRDVPPGTKGEPEEREANLALTQVFGTPMYMAPEVWDQWYAKAADVWSLGEPTIQELRRPSGLLRWATEAQIFRIAPPMSLLWGGPRCHRSFPRGRECRLLDATVGAVIETAAVGRNNQRDDIQQHRQGNTLDLVGHNARPPRERKVLHVFNGKVYEVSLRSRARSSEPSSAVSTLENSLSNFKEYIVPAVPETTS